MLTDDARDALRAEVGALRLRERRRVFPAELCLGTLGGRRVTATLPWPVPPEYDDALLADLVDALGDRGGVAAEAVWLLRPGVPEPHDVDMRLAAVAHRVAEARDAPGAGFLVVTRYGWLEPRSGESRRWKRLRLGRTDLATPPPPPGTARQSAQV
jgi:hypothetical protein